MRFPEKTGFIMKTLCCNCLGEKFIIDPILIFSKCLTCGAENQDTFRIYIYVVPDPTGYEL